MRFHIELLALFAVGSWVCIFIFVWFVFALSNLIFGGAV